MSDEKSQIITRVTKLTIAPAKETVLSEMCTHVEIVDEGGGEIVLISQGRYGDPDISIRIDPGEWEQVKKAVDKLMASLI